QAERLDTQRVHDEKVPMRAAAGWGRGSAVCLCAEVVAGMNGPGRQSRHVRAAHGARELRDGCGDVEEQPVPETALGWSIGVVAGNREALRPGRGSFPPQVGRKILA